MAKHHLTPTVVALLLGVGAVASAYAAEKAITVRGEYFYNFEYAYITPDGKSERWCVKGDMSRAELPERWGTTTVEVAGSLGPEGKYGNLGACNRVLNVHRLLKAENLRGKQ